jgi:hypothetical protein
MLHLHGPLRDVPPEPCDATLGILLETVERGLTVDWRRRVILAVGPPT